MHSVSVFLALTVLSFATTYVAAHGYLYYPPPRGIQKEGYQIDDLKSPNRKGLCRGEPVGKITPVTPGGSVTLKFRITAPHVGPCVVYVLDANLKNPQKIADKNNCAAPGQGQPWTIKLPSGMAGHKVLRWTWEGQHVSPGEPYEQCIDVNFGGSGGEKEEENYQPSEEAGEEPQKKSGPMSDKRPKHAEKKPKTVKTQVEQPKYQDDQDQEASYESDEEDDGPAVQKYDAGQQQANDQQYDDQEEEEGSDSGDDSCPTNGAFKCMGSKFAQCANGKWIAFGCSTGTACQPTAGGSIACMPANA